MTEQVSLTELGWGQFFVSQLDIDEIADTEPARVTHVHRAGLTATGASGPRDLILPAGLPSGDVAVGDWVVVPKDTDRVERLLDRKSLLQRGNTLKSGQLQLIAANIDTLFVTSSCNDDFNPARIERYLSLAYEADITPVVVLTKADQSDAADDFVTRAQALGPGLEAVAVNAKDDSVISQLSPWCGAGQTVALAGSSGVGKTTIANALTGQERATQIIREDDAKGRHTTTDRSLHQMLSGGWLIDTPGMRALGVADASAGIEQTFAEIVERAADCRFRDCEHISEPGCAVQAAIEAGEISADRLARFRKLQREDSIANETIAQSRARYRKLGKMYRVAASRKKR